MHYDIVISYRHSLRSLRYASQSLPGIWGGVSLKAEEPWLEVRTPQL